MGVIVEVGVTVLVGVGVVEEPGEDVIVGVTVGVTVGVLVAGGDIGTAPSQFTKDIIIQF